MDWLSLVHFISMEGFNVVRPHIFDLTYCTGETIYMTLIRRRAVCAM